MARALVVDDRAENRQSLAQLLKSGGYEVLSAEDPLEAITRIRVTPIDVVLTDVRLEAEDDGFKLLCMIRGELPQVPVILYTGFSRIGDAVLAIKLGASDYLEFPVDPDQVFRAITSAIEHKRCPSSAIDPLGRIPSCLYGIVGVSPAMRALLDWIARIGPKDLTALLVGETGSGKELVARALHSVSDRRARPLVSVNCAAIPESLFEAEFFGYGRGAFTGAVSDKPGLFEIAHCGTLFLDEIGEVPSGIQVRLLRVLEEGEVRRLGETRTRRVDVRVIAATNRALREEVARRRFRPDLFYRLNGACCQIPPLRERLEDLEALIDFWLPRLASRLAPAVRAVSPGALALLRAHSWPGNVRELRNVLEHAVSLAVGDLITESEVLFALGSGALVGIGSAAQPTDQLERDHLLGALEQHHWRLGRAAASLHISRSTFWRKLRKHGIQPHDPE
jgi:two-component system response regulator HydG